MLVKQGSLPHEMPLAHESLQAVRAHFGAKWNHLLPPDAVIAVDYYTPKKGTAALIT